MISRFIENIKTNMKKYCGFTLVELLLALLISSILATIAINSYGAYMERLKIGQAKTDLLLIESELERL